SLLAAPAGAWEPVYSLVSGNLPLEELKKRGSIIEPIYLQSEILVNNGGAIDLFVTGPPSTLFWIDEDPCDKTRHSILKLEPGRHRITVRVLPDTLAPMLRFEFRKPAESRIQYELPIPGEF